VIWGYASTKLRTIREPLFLGFLIFTGGVIGWTTIQPSSGLNALIFAGLAGFGFGAPLILIITGVQLSTPHALIATATAVTTSSRAVAATVFTAIYAAALNARLDINIPGHVAKAALRAGLPPSSLPNFIKALAGHDDAALAKVPGVNPQIIGVGVVALKQAFADSLRVVYIIAAPFGALACVMCLFLGDMKRTMDYRVDAPVEDLHARTHPQHRHGRRRHDDTEADAAGGNDA
jgi:Fungal trichothecene efflux pump (TRI12)